MRASEDIIGPGFVARNVELGPGVTWEQHIGTINKFRVIDLPVKYQDCISV